MACRISVPQPEIKLTSLVVKATGSPGNVQESLFKNWVLPNCSPGCLHQFIYEGATHEGACFPTPLTI